MYNASKTCGKPKGYVNMPHMPWYSPIRYSLMFYPRIHLTLDAVGNSSRKMVQKVEALLATYIVNIQ